MRENRIFQAAISALLLLFTAGFTWINLDLFRAQGARRPETCCSKAQVLFTFGQPDGVFKAGSGDDSEGRQIYYYRSLFSRTYFHMKADGTVYHVYRGFPLQRRGISSIVEKLFR